MRVRLPLFLPEEACIVALHGTARILPSPARPQA